jgi:Ribonucleases P/MRP protein subunit POP1
MIEAQSTEKALKNGMLDVNAFVQARAFEINALEAGMKASRGFAERRANQAVPRDMRRRTASHNVKRIPKRLRKKAEWEVCHRFQYILSRMMANYVGRRWKLTRHQHSKRNLAISYDCD